FVRGARRLTVVEQDRRIRDLELALVIPRRDAKLTFKVPTGEATMAEGTYGPALDALAERPRPMREVMAAVERRGASPASAGEIAGMLVGTSQCAPALARRDAASSEPAQRFNRVLAARARLGPFDQRQVLASPVLGGGIATDSFDLIAYDGIVSGVAPT